MRAVVTAFNQEKALVGAFSVIVQLRRLIVYSTNQDTDTARVHSPDDVRGHGEETHTEIREGEVHDEEVHPGPPGGRWRLV